tara:strand:+ start:3109 stop:3285 length:177 start_codon:yes stop_codon:yes gene_type:complete
MKQTTEELKQTLSELAKAHNNALQTQQTCKEQIIALQAVIQDREDGNTNNINSTDSKD